MSKVIVAPFVLICVLFTALVMMVVKFKNTSSIMVIAESIVQFAMLVATGTITKQQSDILGSVFNFVGLLLILELDELVAKTTSFTQPKTVQFSTTVTYGGDTAKFASLIWFFTGLAIYLLVY